MKYPAILWDLDGTLMDTLEDLYLSVNAALAEYGQPPRSRDEVRQFTGNGIHNLIERSVPTGCDADTFEKVFEFFKTHYAAHCNDHTGPYEGVVELLRRYKEAGGRSAIVSNKAAFALEQLAEEYFHGLVEVTIGAVDGVPVKPAPDMPREALRRLGVSADEVLYIGDSEVDVATAKGAALEGLFLTWGFRSEETLREHGATQIAHTVEEVADFILQ